MEEAVSATLLGGSQTKAWTVDCLLKDFFRLMEKQTGKEMGRRQRELVDNCFEESLCTSAFASRWFGISESGDR
jgi:hypothetical protein